MKSAAKECAVLMNWVEYKKHHHHHHWLDSPWWTLAFLRSFAHSSLLRAAFFQLLTPSIRVS